MGNVALDVARILSKTRAEFASSDIVSHALDQLSSAGIKRIVLLGRRGPHQISMTPKELGELGELARAVPLVDPADLPPEDDDATLEPGLRKSVTILRQFAAAGNTARADKPLTIEFAFFAQPHALHGTDKVEEIEIERTVIERGRAVGRRRSSSACLQTSWSAVSAIAQARSPACRSTSARAVLPMTRGACCPVSIAWAGRAAGRPAPSAPTGPMAMASSRRSPKTSQPGALGAGGKQGRAGFDALAKAKGLDLVTFRDWKRIEQAETQAAREGAPREKFVDLAAMMQALGDDREP